MAAQSTNPLIWTLLTRSALLLQWMATNLLEDEVNGGFQWAFNPHGVAKMFQHYVHYNLWLV